MKVVPKKINPNEIKVGDFCYLLVQKNSSEMFHVWRGELYHVIKMESPPLFCIVEEFNKVQHRVLTSKLVKSSIGALMNGIL
jgi:hypothetical protein